MSSDHIGTDTAHYLKTMNDGTIMLAVSSVVGTTEWMYAFICQDTNLTIDTIMTLV